MSVLAEITSRRLFISRATALLGAAAFAASVVHNKVVTEPQVAQAITDASKINPPPSPEELAKARDTTSLYIAKKRILVEQFDPSGDIAMASTPQVTKAIKIFDLNDAHNATLAKIKAEKEIDRQQALEGVVELVGGVAIAVGLIRGLTRQSNSP